jgi:hypothetical protein
VQELDVESQVKIVLDTRHESALVQSVREHFGVLVPGSIENPASALGAHAAHRGEASGEKMELQLERIRLSAVAVAVEQLEPGVVFVDALERQLESEPRGERSRQRRLARSHHSRHADEHG